MNEWTEFVAKRIVNDVDRKLPMPDAKLFGELCRKFFNKEINNIQFKKEVKNLQTKC